MHTFRNGQRVICPSLSTKLMYAYHCKDTNGMWVVEKKIELNRQQEHKRWFNLSGCREETYFPAKDKPVGPRFSTPKVFPATQDSIMALDLLGYNLDIEAIEKELAEDWRLGTLDLDTDIDVIYRFINDDTIEFVGPNNELYTTHYKSLKV